jgi:pimeloyl-ACP methyl ester carboxylesterase
VTDDVPAWMRGTFALAGRVAPALAARAAAELLTRPRGRNPPRPWELQVASVEAQERRLPGGLYALCWGNVGPIVLAQHGWRGRPSQFVRLAGSLVPAGYRVVAIDAPGHGRSPGRRATPRLVAEALVEAAAALGDVHAVVGHSLGGAAAALAVEFGLPARGLVVISSPARPSRMIDRFADRLGLPPAARADFERWFEAHAGRPVAELDPASLVLRPGMAALVVHDRDDDVIPVVEAESLQAAWPAARFVFTSGLGHRDVLADAGVVAAIAAFLAGIADGPGCGPRG